MYTQTARQVEAEDRLRKDGFKFSNWIPADPDADNQPAEGTSDQGVMIMIKKSSIGRSYREIEPDGTIN